MPTAQFYEDVRCLRESYGLPSPNGRLSTRFAEYDNGHAGIRARDDQCVPYRSQRSHSDYENPYDYPNRNKGNIDGPPDYPGRRFSGSWDAHCYRTARTLESNREWCLRMDSLYKTLQYRLDDEREREQALMRDFDDVLNYREETLERGWWPDERSQNDRKWLELELKRSRGSQDDLEKELKRRRRALKRYRNDPLRGSGSGRRRSAQY
ncbi:hypothetical protein LTR85_002652 [Meristemomyces frigidus]|nr:hypothetical protein LTR85_002652 [Meristemomyces frigidus]